MINSMKMSRTSPSKPLTPIHNCGGLGNIFKLGCAQVGGLTNPTWGLWLARSASVVMCGSYYRPGFPDKSKNSAQIVRKYPQPQTHKIKKIAGQIPAVIPRASAVKPQILKKYPIGGK